MNIYINQAKYPWSHYAGESIVNERKAATDKMVDFVGSSSNLRTSVGPFFADVSLF
jgi:hypothetical protein